jgi:glycosyltransferase involved in cell wall biosynthesis
VHHVAGLREWKRWSAILRRPVTVRELCRVVREHRIDIVHSFQTSSAPYALAVSRRTGIPHIVQFRNTYDDRSHYLRYRLHKARVLLALSDSMMARFVDLAGTAARRDQRRVVIPNGIDVEEYRRRGLAGNVRQVLGLAPDQPLIGIVGTLSPRKDSLAALEVARLVAPSRPDARFLFVGGFSDEEYRRQVAERIEALGLAGSCILAGHQEEAAPWFRAIDLLLHTAWREGHAKVFNEAMVFARPIVASRITGSVDVVEDGVNGILCEPGDVAGFAAAVESLLSCPARRMELGEAGRRRVETRFSAERSLNLLADLYENVAGRAQAAGG